MGDFYSTRFKGVSIDLRDITPGKCLVLPPFGRHIASEDTIIANDGIDIVPGEGLDMVDVPAGPDDSWATVRGRSASGRAYNS